MLNLSRRSVLTSAAAAAAALGLSKPLIFAGPAFAAMPIEPVVGHYKYKVGSIEVTAVYDGIWRKPHDPAFIKGVSVEETEAALAKAGLTTDFFPIPLTVVVLKIGDKLIMVDAGSGVGQWQANATNLPANMKAAGIDHNEISTVLISHFHPDHVWGLMEKGTNALTFPNAELVTNAVEYKFWTDPGRVDKLPEGRKAAGRRIAENFPKWKNWKLVESGAEVAPGVRILNFYGHTPGHSVFLVTSGKDQLMISNDTMYVPGVPRASPGLAGRIRSRRTAGGHDPSSDHRPRHRRQDADLRRPFPVPRRGHVRARRRRLRLHPGRSSLSVSILSILQRRNLMFNRSNFRGLAIVASLVLAQPLALQSAHAVDNMETSGDIDLTSVRAKIKAQDYKGALAELRDLAEDNQNADVYNLLGFTLRKTGDYTTSLSYYTKALDLQPDHKAAREYLGELFVETGHMDKAKEQLAVLAKLCPAGCDERADLEKAIADRKAASN